MRLKKAIKKIIPSFLLTFYHYLLALIGAFFYGFPSKKLIIIGVTGTNGKSTVVNLIVRILEEAGLKTASFSSIKFKIGEKEKENKLKMTMPGRFKIQKFLKEASKEGCCHAVLEVTSEGIKQHRHQFINFNTAVFTNLSPEHIESHGSFKKYREAKLKLFKKAKNTHILNLDDENAEYFLKEKAAEKYGFTIKGKRKDIKIVEGRSIEETEEGLSFKIDNIDFKLDFLGKFNVLNALAAISVARSQGISLELCSKALKKAKGVPGRMEVVVKEPFSVVVDYAFTPVALEKVYRAIRSFFEPSKMICVLGACGGGRDKWKRPVLGKIAAKYCDKVIVTNEDPYDEDPIEIINQVAEGALDKAEKILDRKEAIKKALKEADPGDSVVITGKGSEPLMCLAEGNKIPWDDRRIVKDLLTKYLQ